MKPVICFIDDSGFEHDLVKYEIAPSAPDFEFVQTYTFAEAKDLLAAKTPSLFLLDLWGQDEDVVDPYLTPMDELKKKTATFCYRGLLEKVIRGCLWSDRAEQQVWPF
ncbi:MAG: hypothetical protein JRF52_08660 [Deltaproteobacteria bacterium]|nr:hypothetical protein [Deltaproteobacteria bacterium]